MSARSFLWTAAPLCLALAGCGVMPGTGPSSVSMKGSPDVELVNVTPAAATAAHDAALTAEQVSLDQSLSALRADTVQHDYQISPGDVLDITMWSFTPWPGSGNPLAVGSPTPSQLGTFTVEPDGGIQLPYAGRLPVAGLSLEQARVQISDRYATLRILQKPTAAVKVAASPRNDVMVTGAIGQPRTIAWTPAGLTLAQAITQSLGDGTGLLGQGELSQARSAVRVSVLRGAQAPIDLPVVTALEQQIPLHAGDRIVVRKAPAVRVMMLGGGARKDGVLGFAKQPVLAEALAEAEGLDGNTANDNAVFVMRRRSGAKPILYNFAWNKPLGIVAAQQFPLEDGDLVYVAEAPIVSIQKVVNLLFQVTLPVQVIR